MKQYKLNDKVWIHLNARTLHQGKIVHIFTLNNREMYVIELPSSIEPIYEVREYETVSSTKKGPINMFANLNDPSVKFMKKIGMSLNDDEIIDENEPTEEQIRAALDRSEQSSRHSPLIMSEAKPRRHNYKKKV